MENQSSPNQRRFQRFALRKAVSFAESKDMPFAGAYGRDLSLGGVCLEINRFVSVGKHLTVNLNTGNGLIVQAIARVAWISELPMSHRFRVGLQFEQFVQGNAQQINELIHTNQS